MPAKAGTQKTDAMKKQKPLALPKKFDRLCLCEVHWVPAYAGMTIVEKIGKAFFS
jgi:hypothetical protein